MRTGSTLFAACSVVALAHLSCGSHSEGPSAPATAALSPTESGTAVALYDEVEGPAREPRFPPPDGPSVPGAPSPPSSPGSPPAPAACTVPPSCCPHHCGRGSPTFLPEYDSAIAQLVREKPHLFDLTQNWGGLSYRVVDGNAYTQELIARLRARGLCVTFDGEEIAIKTSNDFSDQFAVISSTSFVRWGIGAYRATCAPAWF